MLTGFLVNLNEIPKVNCIKVTHFFILPHKKKKKKSKVPICLKPKKGRAK